MHTLKKVVLITFIICISFAALVIIFISPLTKYLIQKYDEKYTGREITLDYAYVNPFTGYVHLNDVIIHEEKSDSIFFLAAGISLNFEMIKLLSKTYEISEITLDEPRGYIVQNKSEFNFNSLIEKFNSKEKQDTTKSPIHFSILNIKINDGAFYYREKVIPIDYFIKKVNIESTGLRWDSDTIATKFSFLTGIGVGDVKGDFTLNTKTLAYQLGVVVKKFELRIVEQFLKQLTNYGSFTANLNADIKAKGNFKSNEDITATGFLAIDEFHFGKNPSEDYASFDKLAIKIIELSPKNKKYLFDSVSLNHPYFKYERYDYLDNVETMFGKKGANLKAVNADAAQFNLVIEIAKYIKVLAKNFFRSDYKVNRLAIYNGDLKFNDYSISEKFSIGLNPFYVFADSINKRSKHVDVLLKSGIKPYGSMSLSVSISPEDSSYFDLNYQIQKLPLPMFNPYFVSFTSFPLDRGTLKIHGTWKVKGGAIESDNNLLIIDPRLTTRIRKKDINWIPMRLAMFVAREKGNVIDFQVPITGNLNDPKFHLYDVIINVVKNIFVKPVTTPYRMKVTSLETEMEKSLSVNWLLRNNSLEPAEEKFVKRIANFLKKNPEASITVTPKQYELKEKEYILFYEAKKKYFLLKHKRSLNTFTEEDSTEVDKMSIKDSLFVHFLESQLNDSLLFTIQDKCARFIDLSVVNKQFNQLNQQRKAVFMAYFKEESVEKQIKFSIGEPVIPFYGFSFYKIEYKGGFPESLITAYRKMNELNAQSPRKKYKNERLKTRLTQ
jgi:hypothetical protein